MNNNKYKKCKHKYEKALCIHCDKPQPKDKKVLMANLRRTRKSAGIVNFSIDCTEDQKQQLKEFTASWKLPRLEFKF